MFISSLFRSLKAEEDFVDVTLSCEEHQYSAHKVVLSACSPYFRKLLKVGQYKLGGSNIHFFIIIWLAG